MINVLKKIQTQGVHHLTLNGADRQTSINFWSGLLGMPLIFEQPNLDNPNEDHLYFDPGDGRLITIFTDETRRKEVNLKPVSSRVGTVHHLAFTVSQATFEQIAGRLDLRKIQHSGRKDRGFMHSIYFRDPLGLLIELACYRFSPPANFSEVDVLQEAYKIKVERKDANINEEHLADAIENLISG